MDREPSEETEADDEMVCIDPANPAQKSDSVKLCGAGLRKRPGHKCRKPVVVGGVRCELHSGRAKRGPDHPRWKGGAYSRYLPRDIRKRYETWLNSPELLAARGEVALLKSRLQELAARLDGGGESGEAWRDLKESLAELRRATDAGDEGATKAAVARVGAIIDKAHAGEVAWDEFTNLAERATLVAARENRRAIEQGLYLTAEQARFLVASLVAAVNKHADNPTRERIAKEFHRLRLGNFDELAAVGAVPASDHGSNGDADSEN